MIYTFGNSHAHLFTDSKPATYGIGENKNSSFTSISLGPTIAFNFYEHHFSRLKEYLNNLQFDKDKDFIMLIIGEVDCRWHLPYQSSIQNQSNKEIVKECIDRLVINGEDIPKDVLFQIDQMNQTAIDNNANYIRFVN
jgi:hypothetical protein